MHNKVKMNSTSHQLHAKAEQARETDNHLEALKLLDEALVAYQKEKNYQGIVAALQSRVLTYKHLFFLTKDDIFATLAKKEAEASLEIAQKHNLSDMLGSGYFRLGEVAMLSDNYPAAIDNYQKALDNFHGTNAERGDYRYHLGEAFYRNGQKANGKQTMLNGLAEIQNNASEVNPFLTHVWESGCHMKLAELLFKNEPDEARQHLKAAQRIAESDPKLIIRRRQIEELAKSFGQSNGSVE